MDTSTGNPWSLFLTLEMLLVPLSTAVGHRLSPEAGSPDRDVNVLTIWLLASIPILVCTIGRPFVVALAEDIGWTKCPEEEALWKALRTRPPLDDAEFYARFFKHSSIPKEVTFGIRQILRDVYCNEADQLVPTDDLRFLDVDLGIDCALYRFEKTFRISFDQSEWSTIEYSLDGLIRLVHRKSKGNPAWADDAIG